MEPFWGACGPVKASKRLQKGIEILVLTPYKNSSETKQNQKQPTQTLPMTKNGLQRGGTIEACSAPVSQPGPIWGITKPKWRPGTLKIRLEAPQETQKARRALKMDAKRG